MSGCLKWKTDQKVKNEIFSSCENEFYFSKKNMNEKSETVNLKPIIRSLFLVSFMFQKINTRSLKNFCFIFSEISLIKQNFYEISHFVKFWEWDEKLQSYQTITLGIVQLLWRVFWRQRFYFISSRCKTHCPHNKFNLKKFRVSSLSQSLQKFTAYFSPKKIQKR